MTADTVPRRYACAVHEAAHVIVAQHHGMPVSYATLAPERHGSEETQGHFSFTPEGSNIGALLTVWCAGYVAQRRVDPECTIERDARSDFENVPVMLRDDYMRRADSLLTELWPQVEALAARLAAEGTVRF